jgi:hypothetical protein
LTLRESIQHLKNDIFAIYLFGYGFGSGPWIQSRLENCFISSSFKFFRGGSWAIAWGMGKRHVWSSTIVFDVANALQVSRLVLRRQSQEKMLFFSIFKMKNLILSKCWLAEVKNFLVAVRNILLINLLHIRPFCLSFLRLKFCPLSLVILCPSLTY